MNLQSNTSQVLKENHLKAKKHLGQNFLVSEKALNKIVNSANLTPEDFVLEIGPGTGNLTRLIFAQTKNLLCLEKDPDMIKLLSLYPVSETDALQFDPKQLVKGYKVIANIPYYITSPLINHFLKEQFTLGAEAGNPPVLMVLLIQKEVAEKICDPKFNSFLSIGIRTFGTPSIAGIVKKGCFLPSPKVDSAILKVEVFEKPLVNCDLKLYFKICSAAFANPRKTLRNNLKQLMTEAQISAEDLSQKSGIDLGLRAEKLTPQDFEKLAEALNITT